MRARGFTLVEVLIAMGITATMAVRSAAPRSRGPLGPLGIRAGMVTG